MPMKERIDDNIESGNEIKSLGTNAKSNRWSESI